MLFSSEQQSVPQSETVLVLTDGSEKAKRVAEWSLVFVGAPETVVLRIDVLECLDSGVIIQTDTGGLNERARFGDHPPNPASVQTASQHWRHESTVDALHGVPHEALLDYIATNSIDCIVMHTHEQMTPQRSFLGRAFAYIHQAVSIPVITTNGTASSDSPQCELVHAVRKQECISEPG
ncbi:universal stress protein [Halocatena marina]|uniref:universal stress protein n=1 Tax=Halocatena marina TaxID=2934937 RepID=UPI00200FEA41|nr:universal stress protein [Halocatena marina]